MPPNDEDNFPKTETTPDVIVPPAPVDAEPAPVEITCPTCGTRLDPATGEAKP